MPDLISAVLPRLDPTTRDWLERNWPSADEPVSTIRLRAAFAGCGRRMNGLPLESREKQALSAAGVLDLAPWSFADMARAALLIRALELSPAGRHAEIIREVYLRGGDREQAAILRALPLLPGPERFLDLAVEACRTNVVDVFQAIACDNPYPADHFPEPNFNQLVLKALFVGAPVARIAGLARRKNPELRRMARDYASERRAAGRSVPSDIDLVLAGEH